MPGSVTIIYQRSEDGWWVATIPEVPGAFSQGRTREEAKSNVLDAVAVLMEARRAVGIPGHLPFR